MVFQLFEHEIYTIFQLSPQKTYLNSSQQREVMICNHIITVPIKPCWTTYCCKTSWQTTEIGWNSKRALCMVSEGVWGAPLNRVATQFLSLISRGSRGIFCWFSRDISWISGKKNWFPSPWLIASEQRTISLSQPSSIIFLYHVR